MLDTEMSPLLWAVFDEVCANVPPSQTATRQRVAARILELAETGQWSIEGLKQAGREALASAPTMWR